MSYVMTQIEADQRVADSALVLDVEFPKVGGGTPQVQHLTFEKPAD